MIVRRKTNINFIILSAKYFVFKCKCLKTVPMLEMFKQSLYKYIDIERHIAFEKDKLHIHDLKWGSYSIYRLNPHQYQMICCCFLCVCFIFSLNKGKVIFFYSYSFSVLSISSTTKNKYFVITMYCVTNVTNETAI